jgi:hypothetical protein
MPNDFLLSTILTNSNEPYLERNIIGDFMLALEEQITSFFSWLSLKKELSANMENMLKSNKSIKNLCYYWTYSKQILDPKFPCLIGWNEQKNLTLLFL